MALLKYEKNFLVVNTKKSKPLYSGRAYVLEYPRCFETGEPMEESDNIRSSCDPAAWSNLEIRNRILNSGTWSFYNARPEKFRPEWNARFDDITIRSRVIACCIWCRWSGGRWMKGWRWGGRWGGSGWEGEWKRFVRRFLTADAVPGCLIPPSEMMMMMINMINKITWTSFMAGFRDFSCRCSCMLHATEDASAATYCMPPMLHTTTAAAAESYASLFCCHLQNKFATLFRAQK